MNAGNCYLVSMHGGCAHRRWLWGGGLFVCIYIIAVGQLSNSNVQEKTVVVGKEDCAGLALLQTICSQCDLTIMTSALEKWEKVRINPGKYKLNELLKMLADKENMHVRVNGDWIVITPKPTYGQMKRRELAEEIRKGAINWLQKQQKVLEFMKTVTSNQKRLMWNRRYLTWDELTPEQQSHIKRMVRHTPIVKGKIMWELPPKQLRVRLRLALSCAVRVPAHKCNFTIYVLDDTRSVWSHPDGDVGFQTRRKWEQYKAHQDGGSIHGQ